MFSFHVWASFFVHSTISSSDFIFRIAFGFFSFFLLKIGQFQDLVGYPYDIRTVSIYGVITIHRQIMFLILYKRRVYIAFVYCLCHKKKKKINILAARWTMQCFNKHWKSSNFIWKITFTIKIYRTQCVCRLENISYWKNSVGFLFSQLKTVSVRVIWLDKLRAFFLCLCMCAVHNLSS